MSDLFSITVPVADLLRKPNGARDRQVLLGETGEVIAEAADWVQVRMRKDGYTGYVPKASFGPYVQATDRVTVRATHVYKNADFKSVIVRHVQELRSAMANVGNPFFPWNTDSSNW